MITIKFTTMVLLSEALEVSLPELMVLTPPRFDNWMLFGAFLFQLVAKTVASDQMPPFMLPPF